MAIVRVYAGTAINGDYFDVQSLVFSKLINPFAIFFLNTVRLLLSGRVQSLRLRPQYSEVGSV